MGGGKRPKAADGDDGTEGGKGGGKPILEARLVAAEVVGGVEGGAVDAGGAAALTGEGADVGDIDFGLTEGDLLTPGESPLDDDAGEIDAGLIDLSEALLLLIWRPWPMRSQALVSMDSGLFFASKLCKDTA